MAKLLISTQITPFPSLPVSPARPLCKSSHLSPARPFFKFSHFSPAVRFSGDTFLSRGRGLRVVTRAGASINSYIFAFSIPLTLLAGTILTALKIGDDLDRKFMEEQAINEAIMEANEEDEDEDDNSEISFEEKPVLPRTRNRPKKEAEV